MSKGNVQWNLLFCLHALHLDFVTAEHVVEALASWLSDRSQSIQDLLRDRAALEDDEVVLLANVTDKHIRRHKGDLQGSILALPYSRLARAAIEQLDSVELNSFLALWSSRDSDQNRSDSTDTFPLGAGASTKPRYRIVRLHETGGVGEVFAARDEELHREVALKQIQDQYADSPSHRARLVFEAEVTGGLEHPGVVPVYGLGCYSNGRPYYAMRFVEGNSLQKEVRRFHEEGAPDQDPAERAFALRRLLNRFVDVCNTVYYSHCRGVVHRDLKPGNIILGRFGETLVVDWGLAKLAGSDEQGVAVTSADELTPLSAKDLPSTMLGTAQGTPAYMSPEQASGSSSIGPASDVYSLGATLYAILTGRPPFDLKNDPDVRRQQIERAKQKGRALSKEEQSDVAINVILEKVSKGSFAEPRAVKIEIPETLEAICLRCMEWRPEDRYASPQQLAESIEKWMSEEPIAAWRSPVEYFEKLVHQYPDIPAYREGLGQRRAALALVLSGMGGRHRLEEALGYFRAAIDDYQTLTETQPNNIRHPAEIARMQFHLARALELLGRRADADRERELADAAIRDTLEGRTLARQYRLDLASVLLTMGHSPEEMKRRVSEVEDKTAEDRADVDDDSRTHGQIGLEAGEQEAMESTVDVPLVDEMGPAGEKQRHSRPAYELLELLGSSGTSNIWLARDLELCRNVILKELRHERENQQAFQMLLREAQIAAQLNHPCVPQIFAVGYRTDDGVPFITMSWEPGRDLRAAISESRDGCRGDYFSSSPFYDLLTAFADVSRALAYCHTRGVIHCDPKPSNIIVPDCGKALLIDWGMARVTGRTEGGEEPEITVKIASFDREGTIMGTPAYMAPEQARGDIAALGNRTDIFCLGATLFHILTARPPVADALSAVQLLSARALGKIPAAKEFTASVPEPLDAICARAMQADPSDRYDSAVRLADEVEEWLRDRR